VRSRRAELQKAKAQLMAEGDKNEGKNRPEKTLKVTKK
jgi:hypothetical protein